MSVVYAIQSMIFSYNNPSKLKHVHTQSLLVPSTNMEGTSLGYLVSLDYHLQGDRRMEATGPGPPVLLGGGQGEIGFC